MSVHRLTKTLLAFCIAASVFLTGLVGFSGSNGFGISAAHAQQVKKKKRRSLFSIIFGKRKSKKRAVTKKAKGSKIRRKKNRSRVKRANRKSRKKAARIKSAKRRKAKRRKRSANILRPVLAPAVVAVAKKEDAQIVLVLGDFFAGGLAGGLVSALASIPTVRVIDRSKGASGFVRSDIVDWPVAAVGVIEKIKPAYVVFLSGTNDRQSLRDGGKRYQKRSPGWDVAYKKRIDAMAMTLKASDIPFTWVGLPPVRFNSMNTDFLVFNEWYRKAAITAGGAFADVWDGFSDENGAYIRSGPDVNGQIVRLRSKDGINLTKAGRRRLAFYVEGEIRKRLGGTFSVSSQEDLSGTQIDRTNQPKYDPAKSKRTNVVRLSEPSSDNTSGLAGADLGKETAAAIPRIFKAKHTLKTGSDVANRVDNYSWPPVGQLPDANSVVAN